MNAELAPQVASWEEYVGKAINDLKRKHPTLNLSQIAQRINLNRSTLNRIINEGIKPQLDNYIKIIVGSGNGIELSNALVAYDDSLVGGNNLSKIGSSNTFRATELLENYFEDSDNYVVYMLALKKLGTTYAEVIHVIGNRGISIVDEMLELKLVTVTNDVINANNKNLIMKSSFQSMKKRLVKLSSFYKVEHVNRKRNYIQTLTAGMSSEGVEKMQALNRKFHNEMLEIMNEPGNIGNIPMFSVSYMDSFTSMNFDSLQGGLQ